MRKIVLGLVVWLLLGIGKGYAVSFTEVGDAGETLDTAHEVINATTQIFGTVEQNSADLFVFSWNGGALEITTVNPDPVNQPDFDTQLFLFDVNGYGVWANDDTTTDLTSRIYDANLPAGIYYLGISSYDYDPYDIFDNEIFPDSPYDQQFAPQSNQPLAYWDGTTGDTISYRIDFSAPVNSPNPVPEPSTVMLVGLALSFLGYLGLRTKRA
ncbi:DVUA0089 family protein [Thermodesulfatator atlanticus]|uniref:DVUA0089 family protein n=1 Tax=Thermodesulfatator atlanticus TaxID=501497 RepID=UPI0003B52159|nr:DVUA0089 family protein [Thermodesulfatator atlanticus]